MLFRSKVESLEEELNNTINSAVSLKEELNDYKKFEAIYAACDGLSQTQMEKIKSLAESIEFTSEEEYVSKLETLVENYAKTNVKNAGTSALDDEVEIIEDDKKVKSGDPEMRMITEALTKSLKK